MNLFWSTVWITELQSSLKIDLEVSSLTDLGNWPTGSICHHHSCLRLWNVCQTINIDIFWVGDVFAALKWNMSYTAWVVLGGIVEHLSPGVFCNPLLIAVCSLIFGPHPLWWVVCEAGVLCGSLHIFKFTQISWGHVSLYLQLNCHRMCPSRLNVHKSAWNWRVIPL